MSELILNLVWLGLCSGILLLWRMQPTPGASWDGRRKSVLLLLVVFAILFPVISITDDLGAAVAVTETRAQVQDWLRSAHQAVAPLFETDLSALSALVAGCALLLAMIQGAEADSARLITAYAPVITKRPPPAI